jgi:hypothetical protein
VLSPIWISVSIVVAIILILALIALIAEMNK